MKTKLGLCLVTSLFFLGLPSFAAKSKKSVHPNAAVQKKSPVTKFKAISEGGATGFAFSMDPSISVVILRMNHSVAGRFDTSGKNSLTGKVLVTPAGKITSRRIEFRPDSFDSLITLRDAHIKKEYLETDKFPVVALENVVAELGRLEPDLQTSSDGSKAKITSPAEKAFTADLIVKGTKKTVQGTATIYLENEMLRGHAEFPAKISDFPIKTPKYMGVGVLDEFTILVDFYARPDMGDDESLGAGDI